MAPESQPVRRSKHHKNRLKSHRQIQAERKKWAKNRALFLMIGFLLLTIFPLTNAYKRFGSLFAQPATPDGVFNPYQDPIPVLSYCLVGDFQAWDAARHPLNDLGQHGDVQAGDGVYSRQVPVQHAGSHAWQVVECDNLEVTFPANPAWVETMGDNQYVTFTLDTTHDNGRFRDTFYPKQYIVNADHADDPTYVAVGDFQQWQNDASHTPLRHAGFGRFYLSHTVAKPGTYAGYVVTENSWQGFGANGRSTSPHPLSVSTSTPNETILLWLNVNNGRLAMYHFSQPLSIIFFGWGRWLIIFLCFLMSARYAFKRLVIYLREQPELVYSGLCPSCEEASLRRTPRTKFERFLNRLGLTSRRYVCGSCDWKGLQLS